ncbi:MULTISPECIES: GNAT family N-acetyltransferase [unclassified Acinetobacter]|uniref:GNAT family N-acetyltransferase n=1 Tax=unclassified Acinetobacter TaxID=196816 RepID=UPI002935282E|nr:MULTISPECIES: GNAT family N-acetyltransferase [unclassified Acinetobacter]WOE32918.1 GNAT family N-acetyltransferase [Acinetobacter sp. SAAs470]WOE38395.1 GNAT family N-acetyltransferase [Acinetobacter sp. SAAs474]
MGYQDFYKVSLTSELSKLTFHRLIDESEEMGCFVLEVDHRLIGLVYYIFHRSTWTEGHYCYLQDLFIETDKRTRGYGKSLIEAVYAEAHKKKCSRVYWLTQETNYQARILYDQVAVNTGFIQYRKNLL